MRRWTLVTLAGAALSFASPAPTWAGGGGGICADPHSDGVTTTVDLVQSCFAPRVARVHRGATVTFVNRDGHSHDVTAYGWGFFDLAPGERAEVAFDEAGTYPFACSIHPGMTGAVVVGDGVRRPGTAPIVAAVAAGVGLGAAGRSVLRRRSSGG